MDAGRIEEAEQQRQQTQCVQAMATTLRALLAGRVTRADVMDWARELWPPESGQGNPFRSGRAVAIFDSISNLDAEWGGGPLVRDADIRAYLRWITEGDAFLSDDEAVVVLARDIEDFAEDVGGEVIRWWLDGIGWCTEVRFCAPARGRPFLARSLLEKPGETGISKQARDDCHDAIIDLFEALSIDDDDCTFINPELELSRLPAWVLRRQDDNGNRFEVDRFKSYAKACAQADILTARGHKQFYWVDPA